MNRIEVMVMNPYVIQEAKTMAVFTARLTQNGHRIKNIKDLDDLYHKPFKEKTVDNLVKLPHTTLQKFAIINIAVVGASRRFLAQITRHQNEVKFMSTSLQYSDYSNDADFFVPYHLIGNEEFTRSYLRDCKDTMEKYKAICKMGYGHDTAGYLVPQALRIALIISATPYQWKHMISQRICKRNTLETRYIMLRIWQQLIKLDETLFSPITTGCFCMQGICKEGKMSCGSPVKELYPDGILAEEFSKI